LTDCAAEFSAAIALCISDAARG